MSFIISGFWQTDLVLLLDLTVHPWSSLPLGMAIAVCDLTDCIDMTDDFISEQSEPEQLCGHWETGRFAWKLENLQPLPQPVTIKGKQGLWNIPPDEFERLCGDGFSTSTIIPEVLIEKQGGIIHQQTSKGKNKSEQLPEKGKTIKPTELERKTIMINGKQPEITVKFTERPEVPEQGKKVGLQVTGENGIVVKGELNRKTLAKQVQKIDNFEEWIGAFSGTISEITLEGVVILERGSVQIFERKKKVKPEEKEPQQSNGT